MQSKVSYSASEAYARCGLRHIPNPMQEEMYNTIMKGDCTVLLKAPTGSGKTEAVVVPALNEQRRIVMIYPALSLIEDQEMRMEKLLLHLSTVIPDRSYALVVDTGSDMHRRVWVNGMEQHRERRHLYHGDVILTTLDKFLYRFFGFGEPKKSYIYPLRLRYGRQPLFCFDEAHSYDEVAYANFVDLVRTLGFNADAPRDVVVMTATMPPAYEHDLVPLLTPLDYMTGECAEALGSYYAEVAPRPHPGKALTYLPVSFRNDYTFGNTVLSLLEDYYQWGQRAIIAVHQVETAIALYRALLGSGAPRVLLYHGRQTHDVRRRVYAELKQLEALEQEYLLVTTSAIEVGCDLNAHLLITQLCNPEQLIQRAGRCNRQGDIEDARILVIGDTIPGYVCTIATPYEIERYVTVLEEMSIQGLFDPSKLIAFRRRQAVPDYRVQTMFAMLYEYVYQAERANKPLHEKGLVITRSWEPTITLATGWDDHWRLQNELQISMLRCVAYDPSRLNDQCEIFTRYYDEYDEQYKFEPVRRGGCAYHQDIVIRVPPSFFDSVVGYEHIPKVFLHGGSRRGYRRWIYALFEDSQPTPVKTSPLKSTSTKKILTDLSKRSIPAQEKVWWWYLDKLPSAEEDIQSAEPGEDEIDEDESKENDHE